MSTIFQELKTTITRLKRAIVLVPATLVVLLAPLTNAYASVLEVDYKTFYSHVRKLNGEDTQALQFAFGFMNIRTQQLCKINNARISTEKQQIPLQVSPENRFTIPSERALSLARAVIILDLEEASNICDISVQLETKPEFLKASYTKQELNSLYQQYQAFFNEMGSFMSFMMPQVDGLTFQFEDKSLTLDLSNGLRITQGIMSLNDKDISKLKLITLPSAPMRITAKTSK